MLSTETIIQRLDISESKVAELNDDIVELNKKVSDLEEENKICIEKIAELNTKVSSLNTEVSGLKDAMSLLEERLLKRFNDELLALEDRHLNKRKKLFEALVEYHQ